jgi:SPFH domain / Band 7 family
LTFRLTVLVLRRYRKPRKKHGYKDIAMTTLFLAATLLIVGIILLKLRRDDSFKSFRLAGYGAIIAAAMALLSSAIITVPAGHVKVATFFGKVQDDTYHEGLHLVNPLMDFTAFDLRQKIHKEAAGIPAEDKLITRMDVSVQYRTIGEMAPISCVIPVPQRP